MRMGCASRQDMRGFDEDQGYCGNSMTLCRMADAVSSLVLRSQQPSKPFHKAHFGIW